MNCAEGWKLSLCICCEVFPSIDLKVCFAAELSQFSYKCSSFISFRPNKGRFVEQLVVFCTINAWTWPYFCFALLAWKDSMNILLTDISPVELCKHDICYIKFLVAGTACKCIFSVIFIASCEGSLIIYIFFCINTRVLRCYQGVTSLLQLKAVSLLSS